MVAGVWNGAGVVEGVVVGASWVRFDVWERERDVGRAGCGLGHRRSLVEKPTLSPPPAPVSSRHVYM